MERLSIDSRFNGFIIARNKEVDIRWKKVQIFFIINSALMGFVMGIVPINVFKISGCIVGLIITIIWFAIQLEAQYAIDYWNNKIATVEDESDVRKKGFSFEHPHEGFRYKYFSTHYLILVLIAVFAILWLILLVLFLI